MPFPIPELTAGGQELPLGFRFAVMFPPNPLDLRFRKVSGLSATVSTSDHPEGGQNLYTLKLPTSVTYGNLVLERGMVIASPLNVELNAVMSTFKFVPSTVLVTLMNESGAPVAGWMFLQAYPVRWSTSDLDAGDKSVVIDTLELAYARMQVLRI